MNYIFVGAENPQGSGQFLKCLQCPEKAKMTLTQTSRAKNTISKVINSNFTNDFKTIPCTRYLFLGNK